MQLRPWDGQNQLTMDEFRTHLKSCNIDFLNKICLLSGTWSYFKVHYIKTTGFHREARFSEYLLLVSATLPLRLDCHDKQPTSVVSFPLSPVHRHQVLAPVSMIHTNEWNECGNHCQVFVSNFLLGIKAFLRMTNGHDGAIIKTRWQKI